MVRPSVVHDYLYAELMYPRRVCDRIFLEAGEVLDVPWGLRSGMYAAVRLGGGPSYNSNKEHAA
jgi:hypothetical protein